MKILFVKTTIGSSLESNVDIGIASMSAVLKKNNHQTSYYLNNDRRKLNGLVDRITTFKPDIVGLSSTESSFRHINYIARYIRKLFPKKIIVCGGVDVTLDPNRYIKNRNINAICLGEGEYSFLKFILNYAKNNDDYKKTRGFWIRDGKKIIKNLPRETLVNLNELPPLDLKIFYDEDLLFNQSTGSGYNQTIELIFSRGCYYNCTYCSNQALRNFYGNEYVRFESPIKAVKEICLVVKQYSPDYLVFHDDCFTVNRAWLKVFLKEYKEKVNLPFKCNTRVDLCDDEVLKLLRESNCDWIQFGLESGDTDLRKTILNRKMSDYLIIKIINRARKLGIKIRVFVLLGLPKETPKKFIKTIKLVARTNADDYALNIFRPYHGTNLYFYCKNRGLILEDKNKEIIEWKETVLKMPYFTKQDIMFYYKNFDRLMNLYKKISKKKSIKYIDNLYFWAKTIPPSKNILAPIAQVLIKVLQNL